jgi:hypothetical protein
MQKTDEASKARNRHSAVLLITLLLALLVACAPTAPVVTTSVPPTEAPPEAPLPTSTIVTPPSAYANQDAARQATIVARATPSPFPTSGPSTVQLGEPSVAAARRDGLSLEVRLPKDTYLAGEGNRAEVTLRNDSPEMVIVQCDREHSSWLMLLDDQGHELAPWPWTPMLGPGWNRCFGKELAPGQVLTDTFTLQIPAAPEGTGQAHALWVETRFSRSSPDTPQGSDNLWMHLAAGPIPLQVIPPEPAQRLVADLQADREGWHLYVTDADGQVPPGPLWGSQEITSFSSASIRPQLAAYQEVEQQCDHDEENHLREGFHEKALVWGRDKGRDRPVEEQNLQPGNEGVEDGDAQGRTGWLEVLHFMDPVCSSETRPMRMAYSAAWVQLETPSLLRMLLTCALTVFSAMDRSTATSLLDLPRASSRSTSVSRLVSVSGLSGAGTSRTNRSATWGESYTCPAAAAFTAWHSALALVSLSR